MKNLIFGLITIFAFEACNCQNVISGIINYSFYENPALTSNEERNNLFKEIIELSTDIEFTLVFNNDESSFYLDEESAKNHSSTAISFAVNVLTKGKYYFNRKSDRLIHEANSNKQKVLLKTIPSSFKWKLADGSKKIKNFICKRALGYKTVKNDSGTFRFQIEAWYAPTINVPYGPLEFNSLPGLILELKDTHFTFYATEITLKKDTVLDVEKLTLSNVKNAKN